jgi:hypothetical protein
MTALTKVGVTFTEQQKATNKALVEGGDANALMAMGLVGSTTEFNAAIKQNGNDVAKTVNILTKDLNPAQRKTYEHFTEGGHAIEAQKVILKELNSEFKGSAEAQATPAEKAAGRVGQLQGAARHGSPADHRQGRGLPVTVKVIPAMTKFVTGMQNGTGSWRQVRGHRQADRIGVRVDGSVDQEGRGLPGRQQGGCRWLRRRARWLPDHQQDRQGRRRVQPRPRREPDRPRRRGSRCLAAGLIYAYKHSRTFRTVIDNTFTVVGNAIKFAWNNVIKPVFKAYVGYLQNVLFPVIRFLWNNVVKPVFKGLGDHLGRVAQRHPPGLRRAQNRHRRRARHVPHGRRQDR